MPHHATRAELISRARGAFLGLAIGDALGAPAEFMTRGEIAETYGVLTDMVGGGWLRLKPGQVTDDTQMSLCIARSIAKEQGWSLPGIADNLSEWLKSKPIDVGDTCRRGIRNYMLKGVLETPVNEWDGGNGAAMRMLPIGLFTLGDLELLETYTLQQAHLTHNQALSDVASVYLGRLLHLAITGRSMNRMRREVDELLVRYVEALIYQAVAENMASEQSARMVAMKAASDNAGNVIGELKLVYNKTRQAAITKELSEIVSGAAAV